VTGVQDVTRNPVRYSCYFKTRINLNVAREGQIVPLNELQESYIHILNCVKHATS